MVSWNAALWKVKTQDNFHPGISGILPLFVIAFGLSFAAKPAFANQTCPSGADYLSAAQVPNPPQVTLSSLGIKTCYYASKSTGSDTLYDGTQETISGSHGPWAHIPGMIGCTGNCAALTPSPGTGFILLGGDSWVASDLGINTCPGSPCWNGTSSNPFYIGVDETWYNSSACSSWCRPIFNLQNSTGTLTGNAVVWLYSDYWIFDDIEITGYQQTTGGGDVIATVGNSNQVERNYVHGWSRTSGSSAYNSYCFTTNTGSGSGGVNSAIHDNVCDGSDAANLDFMGGVLHSPSLYNNVIRYVYNGTNGNFNTIHDNLIEYNYTATSGDHCNMMNDQGPYSGTIAYAYNNVIRNAGCPGGVVMFIISNATCSCTTYEFNNVLYNNDTSSGGGPGNGTHTPTGTYYDFNNTAVTNATNCAGNGDPSDNPGLATSDYGNFHCISTISPLCLTTSAVCNSEGGPLLQLPGTSAGESDCNCSPQYDQYTSSETYAYSPVASTNSTVGAGTNNMLLCTTIASSNAAAGTACQSDTTYPEYNTTIHAVTFRTPNARPLIGAWDIGAYQYVSGPSAPTGLTASVL
jgi:hypothetical protein